MRKGTLLGSVVYIMGACTIWVTLVLSCNEAVAALGLGAMPVHPYVHYAIVHGVCHPRFEL